MAEREGIFKRGNVWHVRTDPLDGRQRSTGQRTKRAALDWVARRRLEAEKRATDPAYAAAQASLDEWCGIFLDRCEQRGVKPATLGMYEQKLGHWLRVLGDDARLADVDRASVDRFVSQRREEGVSPHTLHKECSVLVRMLKVAARGGVWFGDLVTLIPEDITPQYQPRERALKLAEVEALVRALRKPELAALVAVSAALGLRLSEALQLRPEDVDLGAGVVWVAGTKTKAAKRELPLLSLFRPLLESALPALPIGDKPNNLYRDLESACKRAGIAYCTPNDLRRSHATILLEYEVAPEVVRRLLGHTSESMLRQVYGRTSAQSLGEQAEVAIQRRGFVASPDYVQLFSCYQESVNIRNCSGRLKSPGAHVQPYGLPKPKVARSNRAGGASLSRNCRVQYPPALWALAEAAHRVGVLPGEAA